MAKGFLISIVAASLVLCIAAPRTLHAQSFELRLNDLEKRVAQLEAKLGASTTAQAAQSQQVSALPASGSVSISAGASPLEMKLLGKKVVKTGAAGEKDELQFTLQFKNTGGRDITGIEGDMMVKNIGAKTLMDFDISAAKYIGARDSTLWACAVDYNANDAGNRSVADSDKGYLILELKPQTITYSDGTSESFKK